MDHFLWRRPGSPEQGSGSLRESGQVLVFERGSGGTWSEVADLKPSNLSKYALFGTSVAIYGETIIAGAPGKEDGAAFVYKRTGGGWNLVTELAPIEGRSSDRYGFSVSMARDFAVVSSSRDDDQGRNSGAAFIYGRDKGGADGWGLVEKLLPLEGKSRDHFGFAVAIGRETVAVGSHSDKGNDDDDDDNSGDGSTYIFSLKFNNAPLVLEPLGDQSVVELSPFNLVVPADTFVDPDIRDSLVLSAGLDDDGTLPTWLIFNPTTGVFSGTPTSTDVGTIMVKVTATDEDTLTATTTFSLTVTPGGPFLERGILTGVSDSWLTVPLGRTYASMVVIATPSYDQSSVPLVTRIRDAGPNSDRFEIKVQPVTRIPTVVQPVEVHFMVLEEGTYTAEQHGVKMEAVRFLSTTTDGIGSWVGTSRTYQQNYDLPVVFGQIMSTNDTGFSTFWSRGPARGTPATREELWVGKHIGEDPDVTRDAETIGYVVIEEGSGEMNGTGFFAALGADAVGGMDDSAPYLYSLGGTTPTASAILSQSAMDGDGGGWAVLYGSGPLSDTRLQLVIDEDQLGDSERNHTTEQVSCLIFEDDIEFLPLLASSTLEGSTQLNPVENWRTENFSEAVLEVPELESSIWGLEADPDQNGFSNLHEYAFGLGYERQVVNTRGLIRLKTNEEGGISVEYERRGNDPRLRFTLRASHNLADWELSKARYEEEVIGLRNGFERVVRRFPPAQEDRPVFFRLEVKYE